MKRSNFTFLFLFALLSFASTNLSGQACATYLNVTVDGATCSAIIDGGVLPDAATGVTLYAPGLPAAGSGVQIGVPFPVNGLAGQIKYEPTLSGGALCWGYVNLEYKDVPEIDPTVQTICCGQEVDDYWPKFSLSAITAGGCYADIYNVQSKVSKTSGQICDTLQYVRDITGNYNGENGAKTEVLLATDTIYVVPLDFNDVIFPYGEVEIQCNDYTDLSPSGVYEYFYRDRSSAPGRQALSYYPDTMAWPHIIKDTLYEDGIRYETVKYDSVGIVMDSFKIDDEWVWTQQTVIWHKERVIEIPYIDTIPVVIPLKTNGESNETVCNLNTKCQDMVLDGECGLPVIMRMWTVTDWCNAKTSVADSVQWIKVVDNTAPYIDFFSSIDGPQTSREVYLSTEPWLCYGQTNLTVPFGSLCGDVSWEWSLEEGSIRADGNSAYVWNLWAGTHIITATAYNECNGLTNTATFVVYVNDYIAPVAIAEDQVLVSLTQGGNVSADGGIAKVTTTAIDAGSHDAGCGPVSTCLLLKEELENPVGIANTYYSYSGSITKAGDLAWSGSYLPLGYEPLQCGGPDATVYTYSVDKFGVVTRTGSVSFNVCKDYVKFCCEDLGDNLVALVVEDAAGNTNHSWSTVTVEDKAGSTWSSCPTGPALTCENVDVWQPYSLPSYGGLVCDNGFTVQEIARDYDETCGDGELFIVYGAFDADGELVSQKTCSYFFAYTDAAFDPYTIKWPLHYTRSTITGSFIIGNDADVVEGINYECYDADGDGVADEVYSEETSVFMNYALECTADVVDEPVWCDAKCALIAYSYEDLEAEASDACKKTLRKHTIIDWCTYQPNYGVDEDADDWFVAVEDWTIGQACDDCDHYSVATEDVPNYYFAYKEVDVDGYYTFTQVIKVVDNDAPVVSADDEFVVEVTGGATAKGDDFDGCAGSDVLTATATDVCGDSEIDPASITWWITVSKDNKVVASKTAKGMEATMSTQEGAPGDVHVIRWQATDACGNISSATTVVTFADTKNPTPVCLQDISTATMNVDGSSVAIWASDYDLGSFDNCSDVEVYFKDEEGNAVSSLSFSCDDIANGISATQELQLYVADESGNEDFCYVTLRIDDNADICDDVDGGAAALIAGEVRTELGDMVESAKVSLNKANTDITSVEGKYAFANTPMYNAYEVTSKKDDDYLNGVTTLDLVLIQKHVLGIEALDSPYKVISADINSDAKISGADLVDLRKLILGVYTELPSNDSWRFVDAAQSFDDVANPFPFTEALTVNLDAEALNQDFIAAKIGDVSGNAIANSLIAAGTRSAGTLNLEISDAAVAAGNTVSVAVTAANFSEIAAYQFTMDVAGLEFTGVEAGAINVTADNFAALDVNTVTTAWFNAEAVSTSDVLFTMNFTATADVNLSEALAVSSRVTQAAAYNANAEKLDINVAYNGVAASEFALYQNEPNPFDQTTTVAFELAQAGAATLTVFDVTGKTVSVVKGDFNKGYNTITLDKSDLNASGVLYYQLESGSFTATKKMVVIE